MSPHKPKHIVLIVVHSLRWDSVYLGGDHQMPYAARCAVRFDQARSSGSRTLPATASLFTGLIPHEHGATSQSHDLRRDVPTLAERMKRLGYRTHMVTANAVTSHMVGLARGFDTLDKAWELAPRRQLGQDVVIDRVREDLEAAKTWLQTSLTTVFDRTRELLDAHVVQEKGSFCCLNLIEPHFPYSVDPLRQRQRLAWEQMAPVVDDFFRELREDYDAEVVFCADYGEKFGQRDRQDHFSDVNDTRTRVPLLWLRHDRHEARIEPRPVSTRDVFGTLLRVAGHPDPTLADLLDQPERSLPIMQAYGYHDHGCVRPDWRDNQFAFVSGQRRYAHSMDRWYEAPMTRADEPESPFRPLEPDVDALEVALLNRKKSAQLRRIFRAYRQFSTQIMAAAS